MKSFVNVTKRVKSKHKGKLKKQQKKTKAWEAATRNWASVTNLSRKKKFSRKKYHFKKIFLP